MSKQFCFIVITWLSLSFGWVAKPLEAQGGASDRLTSEQSARGFVLQGKTAEAERAYRIAERAYAQDGKGADVSRVASELGDLYLSSGETKKALESKMVALKRFQEMDDADSTLRNAMAIATICFGQKNLVAGTQYLDIARIAAQHATSMDDDDRAAMASLNGWEAQLSGAQETAIAGFQKAVALWTAAHGSEHPYTGWGHLLMGDALANAGRERDALSELEQAVSVLGRTVPKSDAHYVTAVKAYVRTLRLSGRRSEAAAVLSTAFK